MDWPSDARGPEIGPDVVGADPRLHCSPGCERLLTSPSPEIVVGGLNIIIAAWMDVGSAVTIAAIAIDFFSTDDIAWVNQFI
jgi:hypothetical protein